MRIISAFHDYYDAFCDGSDAERVWKRETSSFLPDLNDPFFQDRNWEYALAHQMDAVSIPTRNARYSLGAAWRDSLDDYRRSLLLFCGKFHPFVRLPDAVCWNYDDLAEKIGLKERRFNSHSLLFTQEAVSHRLRAMFSLETMLPRYRMMNLRYRCPVLLLDILERDIGPVREHEKGRYQVRITLNPRLAELDFQKIVPPFDAYQRLEGYLFNELAEQRDPPIEVCDEIRRDFHGFDKYSFRREPSRKKR